MSFRLSAMNKIVFGIIALVSSVIYAQNDFRKMSWGDSVNELKAKYPNIDWSTDDLDGYKVYFTDDNIGGLSATIVYFFVNDKFQVGGYIFQEEHNSNNLYYEDFLSISTFLNRKYDMERNEEWNNEFLRGYRDMIGYSLSNGYVRIEESYEDENTSILHQIYGDGDISHTLLYSSAVFEKSRSKSALDDF